MQDPLRPPQGVSCNEPTPLQPPQVGPISPARPFAAAARGPISRALPFAAAARGLVFCINPFAAAARGPISHALSLADLLARGEFAALRQVIEGAGVDVEGLQGPIDGLVEQVRGQAEAG